ncbi:MAG: ArsR/SmtB family transcription factor [Patescibacteria group bacterium]
MKLKDFENVFRILKNRKRLEIIKLLSDNQPRLVGEISHKIKISLKGTSKHLILMAQVGLLDFKRTKKGVFYKLEQELPDYLRVFVKSIKQIR